MLDHRRGSVSEEDSNYFPAYHLCQDITLEDDSFNFVQTCLTSSLQRMIWVITRSQPQYEVVACSSSRLSASKFFFERYVKQQNKRHRVAYKIFFNLASARETARG